MAGERRSIMTLQLPETPEQRAALLTCLAFWQISDRPENERELCLEWMEHEHFEQFGQRLHPSHLLALERRGWLKKGDAVRGGGRRYYFLTNPSLVQGMTLFLRPRLVSALVT
jgi:hypothetical protein